MFLVVLFTQTAYGLENSLTYLNMQLNIYTRWWFLADDAEWIGVSSALNSIASLFHKVRPHRWQPRCMNRQTKLLQITMSSLSCILVDYVCWRNVVWRALKEHWIQRNGCQLVSDVRPRRLHSRDSVTCAVQLSTVTGVLSLLANWTKIQCDSLQEIFSVTRPQCLVTSCN